jgi:hypothetical protein
MSFVIYSSTFDFSAGISDMLNPKWSLFPWIVAMPATDDLEIKASPPHKPVAL